MEFRILGTLDVVDGDDPVALGGARPRTLLAGLLLRPNEVLSVDRLADAVWRGEPPPSAVNSLQTYVTRLRRVLEPSRQRGDVSRVLVSHPTGYAIRLGADQLDALRFEALADDGRAAAMAGDPQAAAERLADALRLWRGPALPEFAAEPFAQSRLAQLEERRLIATEDLMAARLELGHHDQLDGELERLVAEHPLRERLWELRMLALYRSGRQADALRACQSLRDHLRDELGITPGRAVVDVERAILVQSPELDWHGPLGVTSGATDGGSMAAAPVVVGHRELTLTVEPGTVPAPAAPDVDRLAVCPYKGLVRFETDDAEWFFGREQLVAETVSRLAKARLVAVVGASGSGKSSLVRAGLVPALARGVLHGSADWRLLVVSPGARPVRELARRLSTVARGAPPGELEERLWQDSGTVDTVARQAVDGRGADARLVIVVDQCEELFTDCDDEEERRAFLDALVDGCQTADGPASLVVALRADFYGHCTFHPAFADLLARGHLLVGPMDETEVRRAVEGPAAHAGLEVEPGLVERIWLDLGTEPAMLPLLSTALLQTWEHRRDHALEIVSYQRSGGVRGAVASLAEDVWGQLDASRQTIARSMFVRLAQPSQEMVDVRRRASADELTQHDPDRADVLALLIERRLMVADDRTVSVAHEALLREWPRLRAWLEEDRDGRRLMVRVSDAADDWHDGGREPERLYAGSRLAAAEEWLHAHPSDVRPLEREFLTASRTRQDTTLRRARRTTRRLQVLAAGLAVALVGSVVAGAVALRQRGRAEDATRRATAAATLVQEASQRESAAATQAEARRIGTQALVVANYDQALLLAVEGRHLQDSVETQANLLAAIERSPDAVGVIRSPSGNRFYDVAVTPDDRTLLVSGQDDDISSVTAYDTTTRQELAAHPPIGPINRLALSPDGRQALLTGSHGLPGPLQFEVRVLDTTTLRDVGEPLNVEADMSLGELAVSPDGRYAAAITEIDSLETIAPPAVAYVWDLAKRGDPVLRHPFDSGAGRGIVFTPDSSAVIVAGSTGTTVVDIASGQEVRRLPDTYAPIALSPDGRTLAGAVDPNAVTIGLFDAATGIRRAELAGHREHVRSVVFSPDGTSLASAGDDHLVMLWDTATGGRQKVFSGHHDSVFGLAFSHDGSRLYSAGLDQAVYIWDLQRAHTLTRALPAGRRRDPPSFPVADGATSADGTTVAYISAIDDRVQLRDVASGQLSTALSTGKSTIPGLPDRISWLAFSPDSRQFVTCSYDGVLRVWDTASQAMIAESRSPRIPPYFGATYSPDGTKLVALATGNAIDVLDARTLQPVGGQPVPFTPPELTHPLRQDDARRAPSRRGPVGLRSRRHENRRHRPRPAPGALYDRRGHPPRRQRRAEPRRTHRRPGQQEHRQSRARRRRQRPGQPPHQLPRQRHHCLVRARRCHARHRRRRRRRPPLDHRHAPGHRHGRAARPRHAGGGLIHRPRPGPHRLPAGGRVRMGHEPQRLGGARLRRRRPQPDPGRVGHPLPQPAVSGDVPAVRARGLTSPLKVPRQPDWHERQVLELPAGPRRAA